MRRTILNLFLWLLVCAFSASAQTVNEAESSVVLSENYAFVRLVIESNASTERTRIKLELLDIDGNVRSAATRDENLTDGKQTYDIAMLIGDLAKDAGDDIEWYRLRYSVGPITGIISMTQLVRDLYDLRIIATSSVMPGMNYRVRVRAVNRLTDAAASGVSIATQVELELAGDETRKLELKGNAITDADGFAVIDAAIPVDAKLSGEGRVKVFGERNGVVRTAEEDLQAMSDDVQFLMMADKPIYQPEQTLNVRGILFKGGEGKTVLGDAEIEFRIKDEDDTVLFREKARTSAFGVAATAWKIPANAKLGRYRIEIHDDRGQTIGGTRVRISRYDLPNFVVTAKPDKAYYLPGDTQAEIEIRADYLFGKPVTKGKVRVVEETSREWNWEEQKYDIDEGETREGELGADNKYTAKFDLKDALEEFADEDYRKYRDINFAAYVTDSTTNKTEQRRFSVRISRDPIHVYVNGFSGDRNPKMPLDGYVSTFYADGSPAACDVEIKASLEDAEKFKTVGRLKTNSFGAGKFTINRPNIGDAEDDLDFRFVAKDKDGRRGAAEEEISFDVDEDYIRMQTDRVIYKPGETIKTRVESNIQNGIVYVDVVGGWSVIDSRFARLKNGRAEIDIPYDAAFKHVLKVSAFIETDDDDLVSVSRGVIFPSARGINVDANFDKNIYKPNEEAKVNFSITDALGKAVESALGIVILDKAVEERARTDDEFGHLWRAYSGLLGYGEGFGGVNVKDLNELDLTKPISEEMQLVAEMILFDEYYYPHFFQSRNYDVAAKSIFGGVISKQLDSVGKALSNAYEKRHFLHPVDDASLRDILHKAGIDFDQMRDPWGMAYATEFGVDKGRNIVTIKSAGPDKKFGTKDDFTAFSRGFEYFTPMGKAIDTVVTNYHLRTGEFIRDEATLLRELGMREVIDRFGKPFRFVFETYGRYLRIKVQSAGADRKLEDYDWRGDDFIIWTSQIDYFAGVEKKISNIQRSIKPIPLNEIEFKQSLRSGGVDFDALKDGHGNPLYIVVEQKSRYWDKVTIETVQNFGDKKTTERRVITPVTQQIVEFTIRSSGKDGKQGTSDDITLTQIVHVLAEQTKDDAKPVPVVRPVSYVASSGAIAGVVTDINGAVVSNATVTAKNDATGVSKTTKTNDSGQYLIGNLEAGTYSLRAEASGFKAMVIQGIPVRAGSTAQVSITLEVGTVSEAVSVVGDVPAATDAANASLFLSLSGARQVTNLLALSPGLVRAVTKSGAREDDKSTPRVREYFPETLLWQPDVVTDSDGKAEIKFRMADNITTWKMYTIASTKNGKVGVAEKEVTAFQSFFVDLDPPKFLTEGDEIYLPTQVRNYTDKRQRVDVTMDKTDWFALLGSERQQIDVAAGESQNAVFGFKATTPVKDGKQRVTAMAETDSDAIEKPVTVRPNGQEVVHNESKISTGTTSFDLKFPANALAGTQRAELRIYPNLLSHVAESVDGLLRRPYGCGEQTISSTYPNLMILKFARPESAIATKARRHLQKGYERLLGYQVANGGFTYWGSKDTADVALTAYALRFLNDAKTEIVVDESVIKRAETWLISQQQTDGSWTKNKRTDDASAKMLTSYVARSLAMRKIGDEPALQKALDYLRRRNAEIDDPYAIALFGLASLDAGNTQTAKDVADRLKQMAVDESGGVYWRLETNTPFYGWGTAGRLETTALVLQLLLRTYADSRDEATKNLISKATLFLLKNKDRYGVWYSTQTTINVLDAFLAALGGASSRDSFVARVLVNGREIKTLTIPPDMIEPFVIELTNELNSSANRIEVVAPKDKSIMSQLVASHYIDWRDADVSNRNVNQSRAIRLDYKCDKLTAKIMEDVTCWVDAERVGFSGYGMLLAEIGTPPGADVSRESLDKAIESDRSISQYEVLPDRIIVYMWATAGGTKFNFKFRPRYGINAQTPASVVYDYYNPEAQATLTPLRFSVK